MKDLAGRTAVITGGGSGLGAAMARTFAAEGMRIAVADIAHDQAESVANELREGGASALACRVDVGDGASLQHLADFTAKEFSGCHLVCANVGVQRIGRLDDLGPEDWEWLLRVNVLGTVRTVDALLPLMREQPGEKHIIITSSVSGLLAVPGLGAYTATKYAVTGYAETLRLELADEGIGVSLLFPGAMATTHLASSAAARPTELGSTPEMKAEDIMGIAAVMSPDPSAMITPEFAIRHLVEAVRENRSYLVTHDPNRDTVAERFEEIRAAFDAAGE
jgi:NAD(P)-dependent dehydrogenase (short-subunit alcohol dehydrogenase family)